MIKPYVFLMFLFFSKSVFGFDLNTIQFGYAVPSTSIKVGNLETSSKFNQYTLKGDLKFKELPTYFLGLELNHFANQSNFNYQNILLTFNKVHYFNDYWAISAEVKYGLGFMRDHGSLYKTESLQGSVLGLSSGLRYSLPSSPFSLGLNINWLHQSHSKSFNGTNNYSSYVLKSISPQLLIIYHF